jgi:hypothetical protein
MNKKLLLFPLIVLLSCSNKNDDSYIHALREMQQLATAEYIVTKVVKADDNKSWYKFGDRRILISCKATIKAGVDLTKLGDNDISRSNNKLSILLPAPQILSLNLSPDDIKVEHEEVSFFREKFTNAERDALLAQAEKQIREQADSLGVLNTAKENTVVFIRSFFHNAGIKEVDVNFKSK